MIELLYREMTIDEVNKIKEIDGTWFIKNVWKNENGTRVLTEINWTEHELPNGLPWHMNRFCETIRNGGKAIGCFNGDTLVGYGTVNATLFGVTSHYVLLDQLFISHDYRSKGIGKAIFEMCKEQARAVGADKLYICSAYAEDTVAFYKKRGCIPAMEINQELAEQDDNDIQMEANC